MLCCVVLRVVPYCVVLCCMLYGIVLFGIVLWCDVNKTGELVDEAWSSNFNGVVNKPADISKIRCEITRIFPEWVEPPKE